MTADAFYEAAGYVIAFAAICSRVKWRMIAADRKVELIIAEDRLEEMREIRDEAVAELAAFDRHADQALEQAEPTPDLRRIQ